MGGTYRRVLKISNYTMSTHDSSKKGDPVSRTAGNWPNSTTLKDVARVAGLSPITVSRAINTPELVRPETIEKVRDAVARTGYIPNALAGGLASRRSKLIAAIVPQLYNAMFADTVQGLGDQLAARGYQLLLSFSNYSPEHEDELVSAILSRRPDGIVLTGINHTQALRKKLLSASIPVVETWDLTPTPIDMLVGFSHEKIGNEIGRYLLEKGYRHFGLVSADDQRAIVRNKGLLDVLSQQGIVDVPVSQLPTPTTLALGRRGLQELLARGKAFDVIVCSSDLVAQGVMAEAAVQGMPVPARLAVMGFGDFEFSAHIFPALSTVHIDKRKIGELAANALLARIEGQNLDERVVDVGFKLLERGTT